MKKATAPIIAMFLLLSAGCGEKPKPEEKAETSAAPKPAGFRIYVSNEPSNDVSVVDLSTQTVVKRIKVGTGPWGIAVIAQQ